MGGPADAGEGPGVGGTVTAAVTALVLTVAGVLAAVGLSGGDGVLDRGPLVLPASVPAGFELVAVDLSDNEGMTQLYEVVFEGPPGSSRGLAVEVQPAIAGGDPLEVPDGAGPVTVAVDDAGRPLPAWMAPPPGTGGATLATGSDLAVDDLAVELVAVLQEAPERITVRVLSVGVAVEEVVAVASSLELVDRARWDAMVSRAHVAPPYGPVGAMVEVASGPGWSITAGRYRIPSAPPLLCAELTHTRERSLSCAHQTGFDPTWWLDAVTTGDQYVLVGAWPGTVTEVELDFDAGSASAGGASPGGAAGVEAVTVVTSTAVSEVSVVPVLGPVVPRPQDPGPVLVRWPPGPRLPEGASVFAAGFETRPVTVTARTGTGDVHIEVIELP